MMEKDITEEQFSKYKEQCIDILSRYNMKEYIQNYDKEKFTKLVDLHKDKFNDVHSYNDFVKFICKTLKFDIKLIAYEKDLKEAYDIFDKIKTALL